LSRKENTLPCLDCCCILGLQAREEEKKNRKNKTIEHLKQQTKFRERIKYLKKKRKKK
jgi:hypothetical protein